MKHSLEELLVIVILTFVNLQGFVVTKKVIKEIAVPKRGIVLTHHIFTNSHISRAMKIFDKIRQVLRFLIKYLLPIIIAMGWSRMVQQGKTADHGCCI